MNKKPDIKRRLAWISGLLVLAIATLTVFLPVRYAKQINRQTLSDSVFMADQGFAAMHPPLISLGREKAFKTALLQLSQSDSLALLIMFSDSSVSLLMKGVQVHRSVAIKMDPDPVFGMMSNESHLRLFSLPSVIAGETANIPKEPLVRIKQPSGPEEAARNMTSPDTAIHKKIFLNLELDSGIDIFLYSPDANSNPLWHRLNLAGREYQRLIGNLVHGYRPVVRIALPEKDLLAVYRALPVDGQVLVKF